MITKELFITYINNVLKFQKAIDRLANAFAGSGRVFLYDCDWVELFGKNSDLFFKSHFTTKALDLINSYLYEGQKIVIHTKDLFGEDTAYIETPEDLWNYLILSKKEYFG